MSACDCYRIDGPFIAEDPNCDVHRVDGLLDQVSKLEDEVKRLEARLVELEEKGSVRDR